MTVKELQDRLEYMFKDIGCKGPGKGFNSHDYDTEVVFYLDNDECEKLELVEIEPSMHWGCNCWNGINFVLKRKDEVVKD